MSNVERKRHPNEELVERLMLINEQLLRQLEATSALLIAFAGGLHQEEQYPAMEYQPTPVFSGYDEVEEDARHMLEEGLIDTAGYAELLRQSGLAPNLESN